MRIFKWSLIGVGALVALGAIGLLVITQLVDPNRFRGTIERRFEAATGRALKLEGDIDLGFFPWLALTTGAARVASPPGAPDEPFVGWREARVGARLVPLLRGELIVDRIRLVGLDARLVKRADGSTNYTFDGTAGAPGTAPDIAGLELRDARIDFQDETSGLRVRFEDLSLDATPLRADAPINVEIESAIGFGESWRAAVEIEGRIDPGSPRTVNLSAWSVRLGPATLEGTATVTLATPLGVVATARMEAASLREILASQGIDLPPTRDEGAFSAFETSAEVRLDEAGLLVEPLALRLDDTRFSGRVTRAPGDGAPIEFALAGDALDADRYLKPEGVESEPFVFPTEALKALRARGEVTLEEVTLDAMRMRGVSLRLELEEGVVSASSTAPRPAPASPAVTAP